ncbi:MAG: hypothetical protein KDB90_09700 [Planctomycetes bacterium]|nr:hypothetical protein [Planctomycetota bacterium]
MSKLFVVALIACTFAIGMPLAAQGGGGKGGNWGKGKQYKGPNSNGGGNGGGQGGGQGSDWMKKKIEEIGWGEDGTEERVEPGDTVKDDAKEARLEEEADKLGLEDKKIRKDFIKYGKLGWQKAEKEDARWAKDYKKYKDNEEALAKVKVEHKEKLDAAWADADESQLKKEILTEEQLETFKKNTKDLREETATDKSVRQDEIRARKIEELKKTAEDWVKAQKENGTDGKDNEVKKEKKDEEGDSSDDGKEKKDDEDK